MMQHAELTPERWAEFDLGRQLLQIAAEMHRATRFVQTRRLEHARLGYERVLRLVDLTVQVRPGLNFRRELLRWRSVVAELYTAEAPDAGTHRLALRTLLLLHPDTALHVESLTS